MLEVDLRLLFENLFEGKQRLLLGTFGVLGLGDLQDHHLLFYYLDVYYFEATERYQHEIQGTL